MKMELKYILAIKIVQVISNTWRYEISGYKPEVPTLIAFWHGSMMPIWKYFASSKSVAIVSQSKDGEKLSSILAEWGYKLIRGSSSKGGKEALNEICEKAEQYMVLLTPDGPKGPIYKFKAGAVVAAHRSGSCLYLCRAEVKHKITFDKSWDRFEFPLPFSKIKLIISEPIKISPDASKDDINKIIVFCENYLKNDVEIQSKV